MSGGPLLQVEGLGKSFAGRVALADVGFALAPAETLAVVGRSGSGKTTLARLLARLSPPDGGSIRLRGRDLLALHGAALRRERQHFQLVFQNPLEALNPLADVGRLLADPLRAHGLAPGRERKQAVLGMMEGVGLDPALLGRYPHELSGGQRQRVCLARALATGPDLLILDEPTASLDLPLRARTLDLVASLQRRRGLACLVITHDLAVVRALAGRVLVLDAGRVVEEGPVEAVFARPRAAATRALLDARPRLDALLAAAAGEAQANGNGPGAGST